MTNKSVSKDLPTMYTQSESRQQNKWSAARNFLNAGRTPIVAGRPRGDGRPSDSWGSPLLLQAFAAWYCSLSPTSYFSSEQALQGLQAPPVRTARARPIAQLCQGLKGPPDSMAQTVVWC